MSSTVTIRLIIAIMVAACALPSPSFAIKIDSRGAEEMYESARQRFYALIGSEEQMADRANWLSVIAIFDDVSTSYPTSSRAIDALYTVGLLYERLYKQNGVTADRDKAVKYFETIIASFPKSSLVDDSQRHIGDIRFLDKEYAKARLAYEQSKVNEKNAVMVVKATPTTSSAKTTGNKKIVATTSQNEAPKKFVDPNAIRLDSVKTIEKKGYTRIIVGLTGRTPYVAKRLYNPARVFIDLLDTTVDPSVPDTIKIDDGIANSIRIAQNRSEVSRLVIDLDENVNVYHAVTAFNNPFRLVIDIGRERSAPIKGPTKTPVSEPESNNVLASITLDDLIGPFESKPVEKPPVTITEAPTRSGNSKYAPRSAHSSHIKTIVIDPGHGGKDPGAVGPSGLKEKDATLRIAKELKLELEQRLGCRVILTRDRDRYVSLDERTVMANAMEADLFISVHINAARNKDARGFETYFLSPARSDDELKTAARENMIAQRSSDVVENDLAYIMSDLSNTQKVNDSVALARKVQSSMVRQMKGQYRGIHDKGVKQAMFYVLWRAQMPSILLETGFITNRSEEQNLKNSRFIASIADAVAEGISDYSKTYVVATR